VINCHERAGRKTTPETCARTFLCPMLVEERKKTVPERRGGRRTKEHRWSAETTRAGGDSEHETQISPKSIWRYLIVDTTRKDAVSMHNIRHNRDVRRRQVQSVSSPRLAPLQASRTYLPSHRASLRLGIFKITGSWQFNFGKYPNMIANAMGEYVTQR